MDNTMQVPPFCCSTESQTVLSPWFHCYEDFNDYAEHCQLLEKSDDKFTVGFGDGVKVTVNYKDKQIEFLTDGQTTGNTIEANQLRYVFTTGENESDIFSLVVSYWYAGDEPDSNRTVRNKILTRPDSKDTKDIVLLLNAIRKLIYMQEVDTSEPVRLERFYPYVTAPVSVYSTRDMTMPIGDVQDSEFKDMYIVLDEEGLFLYDGCVIQEYPVHVLYFFKEIRSDSIDKIYAHPISKKVEIEISEQKFIFQSSKTGEDNYKKFSFYVQGRIVPKSESIFNFEEPQEFNDFMTLHPKDEYEVSKPAFVQVERQRQSTQNLPGRSDNYSHWAGGAEGNDEEGNPSKLEFDILVKCLSTSTESVQGISEDAQMKWLELESQLEQRITEGLVPESTMKSGGLDANDLSHFQKVINEIKDALRSERLDQALSHTVGLKEIFKACNVMSVTSWLNDFTELEKIKQIYMDSVRE